MRKNELVKTKVPGLYKFKNKMGDYEFYAKVKINYKIRQRNLTKHYDVVNQATAKKALEDFKAEMKGEKVSSGDKITLDTQFNEYILDKSEALQKEYISFYKCHIKDKLGHFALTDIKRVDIQKAINEMYNKTNKYGQAKYTPRTVQKLQQILRNLYNEAIHQDLLEYNPAQHLKMQSVNNEKDLNSIIKGNHLTAIKKLLEQIENINDSKYKLALLMATYTARRISEILNLKYSDIDFDNNAVLSKKENKKNKKRDSLYYLNDELINLIKELKETKFAKDDIYVFQTYKSSTPKPFHYTTIRKHFQRAVFFSKIKFFDDETITIHDLRHFFGQIMRKRIKDILLLKMVLDHTDKDITTRYSQYGFEDVKEVLIEYYQLLTGEVE